MPKAVGVRFQQKDRSQRTAGQFFEEPAKRVEDESGRITPGYHLEKPFLPGQQHLGPLSVLDLQTGSIPFDDVSPLVAQRHVADQPPAIISVRPPHPCFYLHRFPSRQGCAPLLDEPRELIGMTW